jgi:hypothetical protein
MLYVQFWAPDDGRKNRLKGVERRTEISKLRIVASCWLYCANILAMHVPMNVKFTVFCRPAQPLVWFVNHMYIIIYLLTDLLTHSMEQSPPWDVNRFSTSQGILCIHKCLLRGVTSHKTTCSLNITICWKFSWVTYLSAWWIKALWEYLSYLFIIRSCQIHVNGVLLASSLEKTKKEASRVAAEVGLEKLKETCYTIKVSHITFHSSYRPASVCQFNHVHCPLLSKHFVQYP